MFLVIGIHIGQTANIPNIKDLVIEKIKLFIK